MMTMEECLQFYDENFCFERKSEKHLKDSLLFLECCYSSCCAAEI